MLARACGFDSRLAHHMAKPRKPCNFKAFGVFCCLFKRQFYQLFINKATLNTFHSSILGDWGEIFSTIFYMYYNYLYYFIKTNKVALTYCNA